MTHFTHRLSQVPWELETKNGKVSVIRRFPNMINVKAPGPGMITHATQHLPLRNNVRISENS